MEVRIGMNYVKHMHLLNAITQKVWALKRFWKKKRISLELVQGYDSSQSQTSKNLYNVFVEYIGRDVAEKIEKIAIAIKQADGSWLDLHTKKVYDSLEKLFDEYATNYNLRNFASTYEYAWIVSNDMTEFLEPPFDDFLQG